MDSFNQDEFAQWQDMWQQALETDDFQKAKVDAANLTPSQFPSSAQDDYWNNFESGLLTEEKEEPENPIAPDSVGKDQDQPEPFWTKENAIEEIANLKRKLYDLEVDLGKEDAGGEKWVEKCHHPNDSKLLSQLQSLREKIDNISNNLGRK